MEQKRPDWKDKTARRLKYAAMLTPPWNVLCWTVGAAIYYGTRMKKDDSSGDDFLTLVLQAPVALPTILFGAILDRLKGQTRQKERMRYAKASRWIARELEAAGITVTHAYVSSSGGCDIAAEVRPHETERYRDVYARAQKEFPYLTLDELCREASPFNPIDK